MPGVSDRAHGPLTCTGAWGIGGGGRWPCVEGLLCPHASDLLSRARADPPFPEGTDPGPTAWQRSCCSSCRSSFHPPEVLSRAGRGAGAHSRAQPRRGTLGRSRVPGPEWGRPGDLPWTQCPWRGGRVGTGQDSCSLGRGRSLFFLWTFGKWTGVGITQGAKGTGDTFCNLSGS